VCFPRHGATRNTTPITSSSTVIPRLLPHPALPPPWCPRPLRRPPKEVSSRRGRRSSARRGRRRPPRDPSPAARISTLPSTATAASPPPRYEQQRVVDSALSYNKAYTGFHVSAHRLMTFATIHRAFLSTDVHVSRRMGCDAHVLVH
jgi:hypothetical protein